MFYTSDSFFFIKNFVTEKNSFSLVTRAQESAKTKTKSTKVKIFRAREFKLLKMLEVSYCCGRTSVCVLAFVWTLVLVLGTRINILPEQYVNSITMVKNMSYFINKTFFKELLCCLLGSPGCKRLIGLIWNYVVYVY